MRIDIHAHYFPAAYLDRWARLGRDAAAVVRSLGASGAGDGSDEIAARLELMDDASVDVQVVSASSLGPHVEDAVAAADLARAANDLYADLMGRHPGRFATFAAIPLPHLDAALAELDRVLRAPGFVGAAVTTAVLGRSIADPAFEPFFEELDRRATVLFIHPAGRGAESSLIVANGLTWLVGAPIEDTIAVGHLIARGIPSRFPRLRIVNAHFGGALPMLIGRLDHQFPRLLPDATEPPSVAARRMWYDTVGHGHRPALVAAVASFGADRLVLGTDFPYVRGRRYRESVDVVSDAVPPGPEADGIFGATAAALLGLEPAE